jgi:hypothetical protein
MSEFPMDGDPKGAIRAEVAGLALEQMGWIETTAEMIGGDGSIVESVFPSTTGEGYDREDLGWDQDQEAAARGLGEILGFDAEQDVFSEYIGVELIKAGKVWEMLAASQLAVGRTIVFSGSPHKLLQQDDKQFLADTFRRKLAPTGTLTGEQELEVNEYLESLEDKTEYDAALDIAVNRVKGESSRAVVPVALPFGYELSEGNPFIKAEPGKKPTGQFLYVGDDDGNQSILLMRIDGNPYFDETTQQTEYDLQPSPVRQMGIIDEIYTESSMLTPIVLIASSEEASSQADILQARLEYDRRIGVSRYGRATVAAVKGESVLPVTPLSQLVGKIGLAYDSLSKLHDKSTS